MTAIKNLSYRSRCAPTPHISYHFPSQSYNNLTHSKWIIVIIILAAWRSPSARTTNEQWTCAGHELRRRHMDIFHEQKFEWNFFIWNFWCERRLHPNTLHPNASTCIVQAHRPPFETMSFFSRKIQFGIRNTVVKHPLFSYRPPETIFFLFTYTLLVNNVPAVFLFAVAAADSPFVTFANIWE